MTRSCAWRPSLRLPATALSQHPSAWKESKYVTLTMAGAATEYFAFPGAHNSEDWKLIARRDMKPLSAWAIRLPDLRHFHQLAHQVERTLLELRAYRQMAIGLFVSI